MLAYEWIMQDADEVVVSKLRQELKVNESLCRALAIRNVHNYDEAKAFFRPAMSDIHDPFLMKDMDIAVSRITEAIQRGERIRVYGDYDVDGTTAVAVVTQFLNKHAQRPDLISYYIPNRYTEGYGISYAGIDDAIANQCTLMISLDCGIKAVDKIAYAQELGLPVIVCDHHLPDESLPPAIAILNPKQHDCPYPFKELSGCGIGFKLICALAQAWGIPSGETHHLLDLVATSIAADIVPMNGENRVLAYYGLQKANKNPSLPISILKDVSGLLTDVNIGRLVFMIGPRINAAGRMNDANKVVDFFLETDRDKATKIAQSLQEDNKDRIALDGALTEEAIKCVIDRNMDLQRSIVLHNAMWHKGVIGIVASRVIERFYKPTILLTTSGDVITGSARSVAGFDIHQAISMCEHHLLSWGGHMYAAGVTMKPEHLSAFMRDFEQAVCNTITPDSLTPKILVDAEVSISNITLNFLKIVEQMEPCGPQNMAPIFLIRKAVDTGFSRIVKDKHLQLFITQDGKNKIKGIAFNASDKYDLVKHGRPFDLVCHIERNDWNGMSSPEIRVLDIKASG